MSEWLRVKKKTIDAKKYREYANIPLGEDEDDNAVTAEVPYKMLAEEDMLDILPRINLDALGGDGDNEEVNRLQELQAKDDLTDEEEAELNELHDELESDQATVMQELGSESFMAILDAGRMAITPDEEDINMALDQGVTEQEERFGRSVRTREEAKEAIEEEMRSVVEGSPYLTKFTIGQAALKASQTAQGNT